MLAHSYLWALLLQTALNVGPVYGSTAPQTQERTVDVAIIGGGAAGTYAAIRLQKDYNVSILLIEPKDHLGGSVSTYIVPETKQPIEFGVQTYIPYGPALDFFARFGIATRTFASKRLIPLFVDIQSGKQLKDYVPPSANATSEAFQRWLSIVTKYKDALEPGHYAFALLPDIPADFLMKFKDFAKMYQLEAAVPRIMTISGVGTGGIGDMLAVDVMQAFSLPLTKSMLDASFFVPEGSNSLLYQRAREELGADVLLSSTVTSVERDWASSKLHVRQGDTELIVNTKRILFTAPPTLKVLEPYQLDDQEKSVFSKFPVKSELIAIVQVPCLPENYTINFAPSSIVPNNHLALKDWPYDFRLDSTGPSGLGLFRVLLGANFTLSIDQFKNLVTEGVNKLVDAGTVSGDCKVDFRTISDHTRPSWSLSVEEVEAGFVQDVYKVLNHRGIWYSGCLWATPYSSTVWAFTDFVLSLLSKDLKAGPFL